MWLALRLSRAGDGWLRARVAGVVRKGARGDLESLRGRVLAAGQCARVMGRWSRVEEADAVSESI